MTEAVAIQLDERVRGAAIQVLREHGWDGLTLERVAEASGRARSTLWRQGLGREALVEALLGALADDFRSTMYPVLTVRGSGRDRFARGLEALCEVIERHLPLLLATDEAFHQAAPGGPASYLDPFVHFLREGAPGRIAARWATRIPRTPPTSRSTPSRGPTPTCAAGTAGRRRRRGRGSSGSSWTESPTPQEKEER